MDRIDKLEKVMSDFMIRFQQYTNYQAMLQQGLDETNSQYYYLHQILKMYAVSPESGCKLVRIGGNKDGGYVLAKPYSERKIAYSFGISNNVDWDMLMAKEGYQIYQYDHTINKLPQKHVNFHWHKMGVTGIGFETDELKSLSHILRQNGHEHETGMLLKMDVEGAEYQVFSTEDISVLRQFDQIVLELHNIFKFPNNYRQNLTFAKLLETHKMVHVHGNNCGKADFYGGLITPDVIGCTFLLKDKYEFEESDKVLPSELDYPNNPTRPEILLGLWNVAKKLEDKFVNPQSTGNNFIFTNIYKDNKWGGGDADFYSGSGSHNPDIIEPYKDCLKKLIVQLKIRSICDIGCGDFNIMGAVLADKPCNYLGIDVVEPLIERNIEKYGSESIRFKCMDASVEGVVLPSADLLIIRQVLQHLCNADIKRILAKVSGKYRYMLITEHIYQGDDVVYNLDKPSDGGIRLKRKSGVYLDKEPYSFANIKHLLAIPSAGGVIRTSLITATPSW